MITIPNPTTRVIHPDCPACAGTPIITRIANPDYPLSRTLPGTMARLISEDWDKMTAAANASSNHVSSAERWFRKAKELNPALNDEQAARLGEKLKKAHYVKMGKLSAEARRLARQVQAELDSAPDADVA